MALRLLELFLAEDDEEAATGCFPEDHKLLTRSRLLDERLRIQLALDSDQVEGVITELGDCLGEDGFEALILGLRATAPSPTAEDVDEDEAEEEEPRRVSIEELVASVEDALTPDVSYAAWNVLAAIIACLGLVRDNVAIVIGAMIVAPLLSPSVGLAVATALGDLKLARRAVTTSALGLGAAFLTAAAMGALLDFDPEVRQITLRTELEFADFLLAAAAGVIAVLATVAERSLAQVGVMVAVALLPPLATAGLLAGVGEWMEALRAGVLLAVNIVGINLAAIVTLVVLRVSPRQVRGSESSRASVVVAVVMWACCAAALVAGVLALHRLQ